jgi:hypothetical protein
MSRPNSISNAALVTALSSAPGATITWANPAAVAGRLASMGKRWDIQVIYKGYPMTLSPSQTSKLESLVRMLSTSNKNEALASIGCIEELQILCGGSVIG